MTRHLRHLLSAILGLLSIALIAQQPVEGDASAIEMKKVGPYSVRIGQMVQDRNLFSIYPTAIPSLLQELRKLTSVNIDPEPIIISSFADPILFELPFIYVNFGQREDWTLAPEEIENLKAYLERGGFLLVDAGITAEFLRDTPFAAQHHSFAEWRARPELQEVMKQVYPEKSFEHLPRSHPVYSIFYSGLPDATILPETVREYVVNEKWPQGTYSMVGMKVNDRLAVLATPIIAMGWGKNQLGTWTTTIGFRIRESAPDLDASLRTAAYGGERFAVEREDGAEDLIYCQQPGTPAWIHEEREGRYRVFRYYHSSEINEFAHQFYTQLGINILLFAMTH